MAALKSKPKADRGRFRRGDEDGAGATALVRIGDRYYGLGRICQGRRPLSPALTKPGADADMANLHIGMALARAGDKAGATAALNAVSGPRAEIAKYLAALPAVARLTLSVEGRGGASAAMPAPFLFARSPILSRFGMVKRLPP